MSETRRCTITERLAHGARATAETGEPVWIPDDELAWDPAARAALAAVGARVEAMVIASYRGALFGSLKRMASQDPWQDPERYQPGDVVYGTIIRGADERLLLASLPGGAIAVVEGAPAALSAGASVCLRLSAVAAERREIVARPEGE